jgi:hypothetical protein
MSVRTELEELAKWITDLSAKEKPEPTTQPLPREEWQGLARNLKTASSTLGKARRKLVAQKGGAVLADFARDMEREAEDLAFRAQLLSRRAPPKPKGKIGHKPDRKLRIADALRELAEALSEEALTACAALIQKEGDANSGPLKEADCDPVRRAVTGIDPPAP